MGMNWGKLSYPHIDLTGKTAIVTGGTSGIGFETAKALAGLGAHTIVAARTEPDTWALNSKQAIDRLRKEVASEFPQQRNVRLELMSLDLASFQSTRQFTDDFKARNLPLHILVNNAGVGMVAQAYTANGYELHYQVNYLSPLLLTLELLPCLLDTASSTGDGRIVFVASDSHWCAVFDEDNFNSRKSYGRQQAYANSKLYVTMSAYALQRRLRGESVTVSALQPGWVRTSIYKPAAGDSRILYAIGRIVVGTPLFVHASIGAVTSINCAVNPDLNSRKMLYYGNTRPKSSSPLSRVVGLQEQLWASSVDTLKDFLSTTVRERYGHAHLTDQSELTKPWSIFQYLTLISTLVVITVTILVIALLVKLFV